MKKFLLPLFFTFSLFAHFSLLAQPPCGFDKLHNHLLATDPVYARRVEENKETIRRFIETHSGRNGLAARPHTAYTIPVVVHVMHTGGAVGTIYNPSDAQIQGAINYLNQVFAGTYPGMTAPVEGGGVVDLEIQFGLAQRTPACGATNGINRVDASSLPNYVTNGINVVNSTGCPELTMKNFSRWNTSDYYNIWIVNKIDGADGTSGQFIAGFAYFPGASSSLDGTVMLASQMTAGQKTLPHELGHALNLYHTFEGSANSSQCPPSGPCASTGDGVCDTDPISNNVTGGVYSFACRTGANGCASPNTYTINTESNFMSYTNCYTLYTNGQKSRVQAAMTLPSRASLVSGSNLALTPCGTSINFSTATASRQEDNTGTLNGCRLYRDYTYQMAIGAAPSANATATLTYTGTAIKGIDYEVTTNGDFNNPSSVLNFAAGSTTPQSFTIRVFNDADVESSETAILDFTVNNGGGNASKGTTTPTFTLTIADNDVAPVGSSSGVYAIGTATNGMTQAPFDARLVSQRSQYLYKVSELTAAGVNPGNITSLQLNIQTKSSTRPFTNLSIKMGHASVAYLVDGTANIVTGMTTVYSSASYSTTSGWNNFVFTTPFVWDGVNNLAFEICYDNGSADAGNFADNVRSFLDGGTASQGNTLFQNGINCSQAFTSITYYPSGRKPVIQLGNNVVGTSVETAQGANTSLHIGSGSSDYFYSNNNKLMMRLTGISSSLGCVSSSVNEAGSTWVNYQGGQRSGKVYAVTPTTNGTTTDYSVSLYFENAELAGKNPATLRIAKSSATSAAASNASNTLLVTPTVTTLGSGTTVFTASFTGFSIFFLVDAGVALSVDLTDFSGKVTSDMKSQLMWTTSSEQDNKGFDVEHSRDGITFEWLGTVPSQGNGNQIRNYDFLHNNPASGIHYYRLKQTDQDGRFSYSKIISLSMGGQELKASVYPVPAANTITIRFGRVMSKGEISIYSAEMKVVRQVSISSSSMQKEIQVGGLPAGIYFIRLSDGNNNQVMRFIKE